MKPHTRRILSTYLHLMHPHERMAARWLTEMWDGESTRMPSWLRNQIGEHVPHRLLEAPEMLARHILLRMLQDHRPEILAGERASRQKAL